MSDSPRTVEGTILRLRCDSCASVFPRFVFSGDTDSSTEDLCCASSSDSNEVVILETNGLEWNELAQGNATSVENRLAQQLARNDLKVLHLRRVERGTNNSATGSSFREFRKVYQPPVLVYSCVRCADGESRAIEELTLEAFQRAGGRIVLTGRLVV